MLNTAKIVAKNIKKYQNNILDLVHVCQTETCIKMIK